MQELVLPAQNPGFKCSATREHSTELSYYLRDNAKQTMNIRLVTVVGAYAGMLPHMLSHYRSLGVEEFIIHAHASTCEDRVLSEIREITDAYGGQVASVNVGPWLTGMNAALYTSSRAERPEDWFILADQDELQVYPDSLKSIINYCERYGYTFIEGSLIDRISETGRLNEVQTGVPVWEQFPLGAMISGRLLGSVINKIVAVKGGVQLIDGQHRAYSGFGCPPSSVYVPVHHFKWVAGVEVQLENRVALNRRLRPPSTDLYTAECERFLAYYRENGCFKVDEPRLMVARCSPHYAYWETIREWRMSAPYFSPDLAANLHRRTLRHS